MCQFSKESFSGVLESMLLHFSGFPFSSTTVAYPPSYWTGCGFYYCSTVLNQHSIEIGRYVCKIVCYTTHVGTESDPVLLDNPKKIHRKSWKTPGKLF